MRKGILLAMALSSAVALGGCGPTASPEDRTVGGAAVGALTGGVLGAALTGRPGGALAGAVVGGATGAIVASNAPPPGPPPERRCVRLRYDYYGNPYCVRFAPDY